MKKEEVIMEDIELAEDEEIEKDVVEIVAPAGEKKTENITDLPGVGAATAEKLISAGYDNLMSIAVSSLGQLVEASGVSESVGRKMVQAARDALDMGFESGEDILKRREKVKKITTGNEALDKLLGGGFETGAITECFGEFGSGKTQVGHLIAVNAQREEPDSVVVYIDTENTFRPERIKQLAEGANLDPAKVLKNIRVARAYNSDHQVLLAEKVTELIKNQGMKVKAVIIDSLTAHFRAEFIGRGTLAERQQKLNRHMHTLLRLADNYNVAVYVTNQVMADPAQFFGDPTKAVGGNIVAHASTFRIYLRKGKKGSRVAKLIDSPNLPESEACFMVTEAGLKEV